VSMSESNLTAASMAMDTTGTGPVCPVCAAKNSRDWGLRTEHRMFECSNCRVVFFDRQAFQLHDYGNYYDYTDDWDAERVGWEVKIRRRALKQQLKRLGGYVEGRRLLDIGAGPGYLCHVASNEGWQAQGVELSEKALRVGRQFLNVDYVQLDEIPEGSLDVVTCYHILEHMKDPGEFLTKVHSKLSSTGVVAVHVPHREPLSFAIRNLLKRRNQQAEKYCQLYVPEHISGFTIESLANTLRLFGFETLMIRTSAMWSTYYDPFFLKNYLRARDYSGIFKHSLRSFIDNVGVAIRSGDWVVGHFRKM